ncbi:MAG: lectin like domain-containing protein [Pirellulales bacterium]|nr:lectin like domain-containing protein [Pirellulales bacterium]
MKKVYALATVLTMVLAVGQSAHGQENSGSRSRGRRGEAASEVAKSSIPSSFDLRKDSHVTSVKQQAGGTCWAHGSIASIESNMIMKGVWEASGQTGVPNLSEYHLDWWNGFNKFHNSDQADMDEKVGMTVHQGGDYRVTAAYISRGDGIVFCADSNDSKGDRVWFREAPEKNNSDYQKYFVRDIEWFVAGPNLENLDKIKRRIMEEGAVATCYCSGGRFNSKEHIHYQPASSRSKPNHSVAIVGWDDTKITSDDKKRAPLPGAWLIKNSWGTRRGEDGYMWISYFDKHACQHIELGAVSFRNIEPLKYNVFYYHDYHGWRGDVPGVKRAFNSFKATGNHEVQAVNFVTCADNVNYVVKIFDRFEDGLLLDELTSVRGRADVTGVHTVDLNDAVKFKKDEDFYVYLEVSGGGQAIDRTSEIPVLLGNPGPSGPTVISKANPRESYYHDGSGWRDLYDYKFDNPEWATFDKTANFCIKALGVELPEAKEGDSK